MKQKSSYVVDLTKIAGKGNFNCPLCGNPISPDDCTESNYTIVEAKVNGDGLDEVVICCKNCCSQIHLTGFSMLQETTVVNESSFDKIKESPCYVKHV